MQRGVENALIKRATREANRGGTTPNQEPGTRNCEKCATCGKCAISLSEKCAMIEGTRDA